MKGFAKVLQKRVHLLIKDKEETRQGEDRAKHWLTNNATSVDVVNKAGTFR